MAARLSHGTGHKSGGINGFAVNNSGCLGAKALLPLGQCETVGRERKPADGCHAGKDTCIAKDDRNTLILQRRLKQCPQT